VQTRYTYGHYGQPRRATTLFVALIPVIVLLALGAVQYARPVPEVILTSLVEHQAQLGQPTSSLTLPSAGSAAVYVPGLGMLSSSADPTPRPIASMTKTMTAYVILKNHPLAPGETGPRVTITQADVNAYWTAIAQDQSAVPVAAGQVYSQYDMLRLLLLPSANNFANILAVWDAGSVDAFVARMNAEAQALGMRNTVYADASGFSERSISTAEDQLVLAMAAMQNPVFAEVVSMREAVISNVGRVQNTNQILGQEGVIGIKTGYTEEAGGCLMFGARRQVGGQTYEVYGVVMGQPIRQGAFDTSISLLSAVSGSLQSVPVISEGRGAVGAVEVPWAGTIDVVAAEGAQMLAWPGMLLESELRFWRVEAPLEAGGQVGALTLRIGEQETSVPVRLAEPLPKPSLLWRLTRI
jgi:serine-type D-Ala-D-Ala carboxypeptidase (penicillin-binding protein 5/6)